jgi:hypothetical protein
MKITKKIILTALALLFSFNANAHLLQYNLNLITTDVDGTAFGGVTVGNVFQGSLAVDTHDLQEVVDADGGFATIIVPLTTYDFDSDVFNLSYSVNVGNYEYTEQTAESFASEFTVDNPADVDDVTAFSLEIGDSSFNDLDISYGNTTGIWSATDGGTGNVVSGTFTVSAVPVPAAVWMFGSGLIGLIGVKRKKA